jgi:hypothetical protein
MISFVIERTRMILDNVYTTSFGAILPRITGIPSSIASILIIYVVLTSTNGFSSIYHRIMVGLSIADFLESTAMSLTTIPMPRDSDAVDSYDFQGTRLGNLQTCTAQGFFYIFGSFATFAYTGSLCVYYLCAIALAMQELRISKFIEPVLHIIPLVIALLVSVPLLFLEMYNPTSENAWCTARRLPNWCTNDCIRGIPGVDNIMSIISLAFIALDSIVIIVSLSMILRKVFTQHKMIIQYLEHVDAGDSDLTQEITLRHQGTKIASLQSLAYVGAFILTMMFHVFSTSESIVGTNGVVNLRKLKLIIQPLQGLLNFFIFVGGKVATMRYSNPDKSYFDIFKSIFSFQRVDQADIEITGIDFIERENGQMEPLLNDQDSRHELQQWDGQSLESNPSGDEDNYSAAVSVISHVSFEREEMITTKTLTVFPVLPSITTSKRKGKIQRRGNLFREGEKVTKMSSKDRYSNQADSSSLPSQARCSSLDDVESSAPPNSTISGMESNEDDESQ